jgi:lipopolysaccharide biosynthesis glycosyltransferase
MKKVFTLISDEKYLEHAKSLFFSAKENGKWDQDFCLIANNVSDEKLLDFEKFGVHIFRINEPNYYYANYYVFDVFFKKWDVIMSMDCDFTIFGNLNELIDERLINEKIIFADKEPFTIKSYFCWAVENGTVKNEACDGREEELNRLSQKYPIDNFGFNAGFLLFGSNLIEKNTVSDLYNLSSELQHINFHTSVNGSDQPIFNLYFFDKINFIENKKISFWRGSSEKTIAQHHCRWEAPWVNHTYSHRLGETYHNYYTKNLSSFYKTI